MKFRCSRKDIAAYAAADRYSQAVETAQKAVELASNECRPNELVQMIRQRLELYGEQKPYREPVDGAL